MDVKVTPTQFAGGCVIAASFAFGVLVLSSVEKYSKDQIASQVVHDTPAEIALAQSHYRTSLTVGKWAFLGGGVWGALVGLGCFMVTPSEPQTSEEKRAIAAQLLKEAEAQDLAGNINLAIKEALTSNDDN